MFVICVEAIMHLLLHDLHDCTFNVSFENIQGTYIYVRNIESF